MSNTQFMGQLTVPNDKPKLVNVDKITTAQHVYYLNLNVNQLNTVEMSQHRQTASHTPCSDAMNGPMNRVIDIKSGHDFCRYRNSIQVIYFQTNGSKAIVILCI